MVISGFQVGDADVRAANGVGLDRLAQAQAQVGIDFLVAGGDLADAVWLKYYAHLGLDDLAGIGAVAACRWR